ncbi:MAG TPA: glycosyltransferase family 2 protein [Frankiaceae bacterium]|nr:glycosyltransferase family 2 protein [Frankiaceae bacterium]
MKLSVLMPVYNEARTVELAAKRLLDVDFPCEVELIVVDDGSTDGTTDLVRALGGGDPRVIVGQHPRNRGKGAAVRTAAQHASGDYLLIYDADLEYPPEQIPKLLEPILAGEAEVVYGTRVFGGTSAFTYWYVQGNRAVTTAANVLFNAYITDLSTCFKLLPLPLYRELRIRENGFGADPELTAKLLKRGIRPFEIPITYRSRTRAQGKKITWRHGFEALGVLLRVRLGLL